MILKTTENCVQTWYLLRACYSALTYLQRIPHTWPREAPGSCPGCSPRWGSPGATPPACRPRVSPTWGIAVRLPAPGEVNAAMPGVSPTPPRAWVT